MNAQQAQGTASQQAKQQLSSGTQASSASGRAGQGESAQQRSGDATTQSQGGNGKERQRAEQAMGQQQSAAGGLGQSSRNQEALREDIQQLLKEVSGELKQLQAQMAAAEHHSPPEAGMSSDPNLYESPMPLERSAGEAVPIQLKTDTAQTAAQRPGGGVGTPSGEVSSAMPRTQAEDAQLSDQPLEETPVSRQPVPPEYQSVFDQLRKPNTPPAEKKP